MYTDASGTLQQDETAVATVPAAGASCDGDEEVADYTGIQAEACGYDTIPRDHQITLSGGGTESVYYQNGGETFTTVPPTSFDPATAEATQLAEYGYPPRPADTGSDAYANWVDEVGGTRVTPKAFLLEAKQDKTPKTPKAPGSCLTTGGLKDPVPNPCDTGQSGPGFIGGFAKGVRNGTETNFSYQEISTTYIEPDGTADTNCDSGSWKNQVMFLAGLGGLGYADRPSTKGETIGEVGTTPSGTGNKDDKSAYVPPNYAFAEISNGGNDSLIPITPLFKTAEGRTEHATVTYIPPNSGNSAGYYFYISDGTQNAPLTHYDPRMVGGNQSAEFFIERPTLKYGPGGNSWLWHFYQLNVLLLETDLGSIDPTGAKTQDFQMWNSASPRVQYDTHESGGTSASGKSDVFHSNWHTC